MNKKIYILGLARSGVAACMALQKKGYDIIAFDDGEKDILLDGVRLTHYNEVDWSDISYIIISPGISKKHKIYEISKKESVPIYSDIEIFVNLLDKAKIIGVTGTNGKSTTCSLIYHILKEAGFKVQLGGNIGEAVFNLKLRNEEDEFYVLELSSYQLENIKKAGFNDAILLNITPDHIDYHQGFENYVKAKKKIFANARENYQAIISIDDFESAKICEEQKGITISTNNEQADLYLKKDYLCDGENKFLIAEELIRKAGSKQNILAAYAIAEKYGVSNFVEKLTTFQPLEHRMEFVKEVNGVSIYNDSKATNAESTINAIKILEDICWIAGGVAKEGGIEPILPLLKKKVNKIYLFGESKNIFKQQLESVGFTNIVFCDSLQEIVKNIIKELPQWKYKNVLFSPAAASFDMWRNFEERGKEFKRLILA